MTLTWAHMAHRAGTAQRSAAAAEAEAPGRTLLRARITNRTDNRLGKNKMLSIWHVTGLGNRKRMKRRQCEEPSKVHFFFLSHAIFQHKFTDISMEAALSNWERLITQHKP